MKRILLAGALSIVPVLTLAEEGPRISDAWARATILPSRPGAAYLTLESTTGDRLLGVTSPTAKKIMVHRVEVADGISRMIRVEALDLPPGEAVIMAPGDLHMMMMGLTEKLEQGAHFPLTLHFEQAGERTVEVSVLGIAATGPQDKGQ